MTTVSIDFAESRDIKLNNSDSIDLYVDKIKKYKGVLILQDSVALSQNCPLIKNIEYNNSKTLVDFEEPYRIIKQRNSNVIQMIRLNDTLYFKNLY